MQCPAAMVGKRAEAGMQQWHEVEGIAVAGEQRRAGGGHSCGKGL